MGQPVLLVLHIDQHIPIERAIGDEPADCIPYFISLVISDLKQAHGHRLAAVAIPFEVIPLIRCVFCELPYLSQGPRCLYLDRPSVDAHIGSHIRS